MNKRFNIFTGMFLLGLTLTSMAMSGCAAALIGAGAVGGFAVAKHLDDDAKLQESQQGNKGWFGGK